MCSREIMLSANGVELCVQMFGRHDAPPILLIGAAGSSMDWWEDEFCHRLAAGARLVIRYDGRDTGRSACCAAGAPTYTQDDLAADAVGIIDALGLERVHVVGIAMGGGIAQRMVLRQPHRVASLTLVSTSPGGTGGPEAADLPAMSARIEDGFDDPEPEPDWSDRHAVAEYIVHAQVPLRGSLPFDEARLRELIGRVLKRTVDIEACLTNPWIAGAGELVRPRLAEVTAPTLVLHGTEDPLLPFGHAEALAREIRGAELVALHGVGHEVMTPYPIWNGLVTAILRHTSGTRWA